MEKFIFFVWWPYKVTWLSFNTYKVTWLSFNTHKVTWLRFNTYKVTWLSFNTYKATQEIEQSSQVNPISSGFLCLHGKPFWNVKRLVIAPLYSRGGRGGLPKTTCCLKLNISETNCTFQESFWSLVVLSYFIFHDLIRHTLESRDEATLYYKILARV